MLPNNRNFTCIVGTFTNNLLLNQFKYRPERTTCMDYKYLFRAGIEPAATNHLLPKPVFDYNDGTIIIKKTGLGSNNKY